MTHYLHGLHASSWRDGITPPSTKFPGWLTFTEIAGSEGGDYRRWADAGYGIIVRLNNAYYPNGTIPKPEDYAAFATRCAAFVDHSQGCHVWIIGNECNMEQERPGGIPIQPEQYAACFLMCYAAIKGKHPDHLVLPAPIAPYNAQTGDCLAYLGRVAQRLASAGAVDGWAIHAYTRAHDPALIVREEIVNGWQWHFRTYRDQLGVLAQHAVDVPIFLSEFNPTNGWVNEDRGYIGEALCEIDTWNQANPRQVIRACCAFRWHDPSRPEWTIRDKPGVVTDYCRAADVGYTWDSWDNDDNEEEPMTEEWREQYVCRCESGFWDQGGKPEFTIPVRMQLYFLHNPDNPAEFNEPEADAKDRQLGHSEVYEGRFSAVVYAQNSTGLLWLVTDPIYVETGRAVRGELMYMHVFRNGHGGARAGIVDGDGKFDQDHARAPFEREAIEEAVTWGGWQGTYGDNALPQREWVKLTAPEIIPTVGHVRLVVQFSADYAGFSAGHFDVFRVEQYAEEGEPEPGPEPGPGGVVRIEVTGKDGGPIEVRLVE